MNAVIFTLIFLLCVLMIVVFRKAAKINTRIDDIYNKALEMKGEIESNTARSKDNYKLIARVNTAVEGMKTTIRELRESQEKAKEVVVDAELQEIAEAQDEVQEEVSDENKELAERRSKYSEYRKQGMDIKSAGVAVGVSYATAKRYEKWRNDNKK
jgi:chromosome segregation ATPase